MKESRGITPLRTILQNCLNHIENLETNRSITDNYDKEFQDLKHFSESLKAQKEYSCTEGEKEVNRKKNRYKDILPFNVSRVVLSEYAGIPGSDYINANYIKGASGSPAYIASQGPLPNTVNDFWRMVVECEVQVIVMACNAQESGKHKCENYWVEKEGEEKRFGMVQICLVKASTVCPDFLVRTMRLKYTNDKDVTEERTVCQFHYSAWPDHGVPPLVRPLLDMVRLVRDTQASETLPVLVHCSAGCGRTGTICAIDFVWGLLRAGKLTEEFSLFNLVRDMRKQRVAMVQTKEQYILVHQAVRELFKEQLRVIESHPYENIDFNGVPLIKDFEEPFYDTISIQKEENCDEKQDKSELKEKGEDVDRLPKPDTAPPLPRKKRPNVLFSKQEKEAENLTEKNRTSFAEKEREKEKTDASLTNILGKPRIVKLRALFEKTPASKERSGLKDRGSQTVSRSHSLGAIRKPLTTETFDVQPERIKPSCAPPPPPTAPDPSKLKHSKSFSKSVPLIKRSKSLKTFSQSSHLSVSPQNTVERKVSHAAQPRPYESVTLLDKESWKPSPVTCDIPKECSVRRRSLESLMGDVAPSVTWPTGMAAADRAGSNMKNRQKSLDWSPKLYANTIQGNKTAEVLKQQLQRLSLETEKKMNSLTSGIGVRERRNSFRQAVTKNDLQNVFHGKKVLSNDTHQKTVKNSNEILRLIDQPDGVIYLEREAPVDVKLMRTKSFFDPRKYKVQERYVLEPVKKVDGKYPLQHSSGAVDPRSPKSILSKTSRTYEDIERPGDPKNLFLKKLNSELLSDCGSDRSRSSYENIDKSHSRGFAPVPVHGDAKKNLIKSSSSFAVKQEGYDDHDGANGRYFGEEKVFQPSTRQNFAAHQTYVKPQKPAKPTDCFKCYKAPPPPQPSAFSRPSAPPKNPQNSVGESGTRSEKPQEVRSKESFFSIPHKKNISLVAPSKAHPSHDNEVTFGSYRRNPNSDLYVKVSPEFDNNDKKLMLPPKMAAVEKSSKNYDCLPWPPPSSHRSSSDTNSSDSKSESSRLMAPYEPENSIKSEVKIIKKVDQGGKVVNIVRFSDSRKVAQNSEQPNMMGMQKREEMKPGFSADYCNYGVVGTSKPRPNVTKYSKDDFVLEEPTAPPRVKRHASVTAPRNAVNGSDHVSSWTPSDSKLNTSRNTNIEVDQNAWSGSIGVDLDAVAASMQQGKKDRSGSKEPSWPSENHSSSSSSSSSKKKQHYF